MKRFFSLLVVMAFAIAARALNSIMLGSASGHPGDEVTVTVSLAADDAVSAVDITIPLTKYTSYVDGSAQLVEARSGAGHQVSAAYTDGALRILVYNLTLKPLTGSGDLLTFKLLLGKEPTDYALTPTVKLSDDAGSALNVTATGSTVTLLSPKIEVDTPTIDFGRSAIRGSYTRNLTLRNVGNEPLKISGFKTTASELTISPTSGTIAAGKSSSFTVTYSPVTRAAGIEERISIESDAVNGTKTATVTAIPFSVNELHVSNAEGVSDSEVAISLTMNNMEPIVSAQCSFKLPDALKYVDGSITACSRANGHSVSATCSDDGVLTLFIISLTNTPVSDNDGELMSFKVRLDGKSGYYYLTPQKVVLSNASSENMTSATSEGRVRINAPKISCNSSVALGENSVTEGAKAQFTIGNSGQVPLTVNSVVFANAGYSVAEDLPLTVSANSSKTITVNYAGAEAGDFSTTMNIYSNDPTARLTTVAVNGMLYEPNALEFSGDASDDYNSFTLHVDLTNYTEIVAMQLDIHGISGMSMGASDLVLASRAASHTASISEIEDDVYRVVIFSLANDAFAGNSGRVFDLTFSGANCLNRQFNIDNIKLSNAEGVNNTSPNASVSVVKVIDESTAVNDILSNEEAENFSIYTIGGKTVKLKATAGDISKLSPGYYIINNSKVLIR